MNKVVKLQFVTKADLKQWWEKSYGPEADLKWMQFNGPYFQDPVLTWEAFYDHHLTRSVNNPMRKLIIYNGTIVGELSAYWTDGTLKQWLELGIVLFDSDSWGHGIGTAAFRLWIQEMFDLFSYLPHVGFTTWSGNKGMQVLGEKVGMTKEGVIRNVRYWKSEYYDVIKYGILRNEIKQF
ncbi:GNAT family N-acetyltransferase [Leuconostoc citreum]